jgi:hypothetical protein
MSSILRDFECLSENLYRQTARHEFIKALLKSDHNDNIQPMSTSSNEELYSRLSNIIEELRELDGESANTQLSTENSTNLMSEINRLNNVLCDLTNKENEVDNQILQRLAVKQELEEQVIVKDAVVPKSSPPTESNFVLAQERK